MLKKIGKAFLTGGCIGVVGEALIQLCSLVVKDSTYAMMLGILLFGVLGVGLILSGLYFKISRFGEDGAAIPVCGLMFGAAMGAAGAEEAGMSRTKAVLMGFWGVLKVLGSGYVLAFILGMILH